jgi:hypothetical protein
MRHLLRACLCLAVAACAPNTDGRTAAEVKQSGTGNVHRVPLALPARVQAELSPEITRRLTEDEYLAVAPGANGPSFGCSYSFKDSNPSDPFTSRTEVRYEHLPESGVVMEDEHYTEADGYLKTSTNYYAAAGLLRLLEISETTNKVEKSADILRLTNYRISGDLFPVSVGNEFSIDLTLSGDIELTLKHDCEVERELPAQRIDPALRGRALYVQCAVQVLDRKPGLQDYFYVEELGFFLPNFLPSDCRECSDYELTVDGR